MLLKRKKYFCDTLKGYLLDLVIQETLNPSLGDILEMISELYKVLVCMANWKQSVAGKGNKK